MNETRTLRSIVALILAVVGWAWLHSHLMNDAPRQRPAPLSEKSVAVKTSVPVKTKDDAPANAFRTIEGRALGLHGTPVAGATVWLTRQELSKLDIPEPVVLAECQTRPDGRFELTVLESEFKKHTDDPLHEFDVWIWKPGFAVAHRCTFGEALGDQLCVGMVPESPLAIRLQNPDGSPCPSAIVTPMLLSVAGDHWLPKPLQERLKTHATHAGQVDVPGWSRGRVELKIETKEFGRQNPILWPREGNPIVVALRETRTVEGRIVLPAGEKVDLSTLRLALLQVSHGDPKSVGKKAGHQSTETAQVEWQDPCVTQPDRDGRFTFRKLPLARRGTLHLHIAGLPQLGLADDRDSECVLEELPSGKTLKIDIPARKGTWATCVARDSYSKQPLPNVDVTLMSSTDFQSVGSTDENGRLRVRLCPGETYRIDCTLPPGYVRTTFGPEAYVEIPTNTAECELPPIELVRACPLVGQARDTAGRPLGGVRVRASWRTFETKAGKKSTEVTQWARTDAAGHFRFEQVEAGATVTLVMARAGIALGAPVQTVAGSDESFCLHEQKDELIALSGRIVGLDGQPLSGARVHIESGESPDPIGAFCMTVGADGCFHTPRQFPARLKYRLTVRSFLADVASSSWQCPATSGDHFPELAVERSKVSVASKLSGKEIVARVNGLPIYASELLERAFVEPLETSGLSLLTATKSVESGEMTDQDFRSLQEMAIKKYLPECIRTRLLAQACQSSLEKAGTINQAEGSIGNEFDNYVKKLEHDFAVTSPDEVDLKLTKQGTSLKTLKAEYRYRMLADEYLREASRRQGIERPQLLAHYRNHRQAYATSEKVAWQLLEVHFDAQRFEFPRTTADNGKKSTDWPQAETYKEIGHELAAEPTSEPSELSLTSFEKHPKQGIAYALNDASESDKPESSTAAPAKSWGWEVGKFIGKQKGHEIMRKALSRLKKGESFETVVNQFSDGPEADQGGWQRPTRPGSVADPKTAAALHKLPEGETSPVIEGDTSLRVVRVVTRTPAGYQPFEEVEQSIRRQLTQDCQKQIVSELYSRATIESAYAIDAASALQPARPTEPTFPDEWKP